MVQCKALRPLSSFGSSFLFLLRNFLLRNFFFVATSRSQVLPTRLDTETWGECAGASLVPNELWIITLVMRHGLNATLPQNAMRHYVLFRVPRPTNRLIGPDILLLGRATILLSYMYRSLCLPRQRIIRRLKTCNILHKGCYMITENRRNCNGSTLIASTRHSAWDHGSIHSFGNGGGWLESPNRACPCPSTKMEYKKSIPL